MKYQINYNGEHKIVNFKVYDSLTGEEARVLINQIEKMIEGKTCHGILVDLSEDKAKKGMSKEVREVFKDATKRVSINKICVIGARAVNRMTARIVLSLMGNTSTQFCKSRKEALAWMKGEKP
jgi:hypothetical protein